MQPDFRVWRAVSAGDRLALFRGDHQVLVTTSCTRGTVTDEAHSHRASSVSQIRNRSPLLGLSCVMRPKLLLLVRRLWCIVAVQLLPMQYGEDHS